MNKYEALKDGKVVGEGDTFNLALQDAVNHGHKRHEVILRSVERPHVHR